MERARHRKSKSASGIEGIRQIQQQKAASRLSSDSRSYIDGSHRMIWTSHWNTNEEVTGRRNVKRSRIKKRSPSVIARLMGLDGLPSPRHVHRQQKRYTDSYQYQDASANVQRNSQLYDGRSNRRSSLDHQEFKDVYEDLEASHVVNRRCSSRWSASSILTKPEMALIRQKFIDAKRLSADEMLQDSKELDDTLEMLDSNKDLLLKFLQQPDSLFVKHLHDLHVDPGSSLGSRIAVLKPSNSEKYESKAKAWRSERDTSSKHQVTSHLKRKDGLLLEPHNRHRSHVSRNSSRIQLDEKDEDTILPTRIVVLKPNLGKMQNPVTTVSSPDQSNGYQPSFKKIKEYPSVQGTESISSRRKDPSHNLGFPMSCLKKLEKWPGKLQ
ncbi:hypothetical protein Sango_1463900 [Sesamum angolense]|uniref:DUF3741 domain-containing protein n=1 Tax=Sesamum angolense TaxID=2727404 RepID=A0AAE2BST7_9LAMI|nr:hypothetical protein Sango_1463900 [Sesamum angolense]